MHVVCLIADKYMHTVRELCLKVSSFIWRRDVVCSSLPPLSGIRLGETFFILECLKENSGLQYTIREAHDFIAEEVYDSHLRIGQKIWPGNDRGSPSKTHYL